jgi:hypothetical protein
MNVIRHNHWLLAFCCLCVSGSLLACSGKQRVPPPETALQRYVTAVRDQDAAALRDMLKESARDEYSVAEIRELLERDAAEFKERAGELSRAERKAGGMATVFLRAGRRAELSLEDGVFKVHSAGMLPAKPTSPEAAALHLREAILARDYHRIEQVLSTEAREEFAGAFERLSASLESLDTAVINVREDRATIEFMDGRTIILRREGMTWKIEEFE